MSKMESHSLPDEQETKEWPFKNPDTCYVNSSLNREGGAIDLYYRAIERPTLEQIKEGALDQLEIYHPRESEKTGRGVLIVSMGPRFVGFRKSGLVKAMFYYDLDALSARVEIPLELKYRHDPRCLAELDATCTEIETTKGEVFNFRREPRIAGRNFLMNGRKEGRDLRLYGGEKGVRIEMVTGMDNSDIPAIEGLSDREGEPEAKSVDDYTKTRLEVEKYIEKKGKEPKPGRWLYVVYTPFIDLDRGKYCQPPIAGLRYGQWLGEIKRVTRTWREDDQNVNSFEDF